MLRGFCGMSDEQWSLAVQFAGITLAFRLGYRRRRGFPLATAVLLGIGIDVMAQFVLMGGGPGALVGIVLFPVYCCLAAAVGKCLRLLVDRISGRRSASP